MIAAFSPICLLFGAYFQQIPDSKPITIKIYIYSTLSKDKFISKYSVPISQELLKNKFGAVTNEFIEDGPAVSDDGEAYYSYSKQISVILYDSKTGLNSLVNILKQLKFEGDVHLFFNNKFFRLKPA